MKSSYLLAFLLLVGCEYSPQIPPTTDIGDVPVESTVVSDEAPMSGVKPGITPVPRPSIDIIAGSRSFVQPWAGLAPDGK